MAVVVVVVVVVSEVVVGVVVVVVVVHKGTLQNVASKPAGASVVGSDFSQNENLPNVVPKPAGTFYEPLL